MNARGDDTLLDMNPFEAFVSNPAMTGSSLLGCALCGWQIGTFFFSLV